MTTVEERLTRLEAAFAEMLKGGSIYFADEDFMRRHDDAGK